MSHFEWSRYGWELLSCICLSQLLSHLNSPRALTLLLLATMAITSKTGGLFLPPAAEMTIGCFRVRPQLCQTVCYYCLKGCSHVSKTVYNQKGTVWHRVCACAGVHVCTCLAVWDLTMKRLAQHLYIFYFNKWVIYVFLQTISFISVSEKLQRDTGVLSIS